MAQLTQSERIVETFGHPVRTHPAARLSPASAACYLVLFCAGCWAGVFWAVDALV